MDVDATLDVLNHLKARGELFIELIPPFPPFFQVDRAVLRQTIKERGGTEEAFHSHAADISRGLGVILNGFPDDYIEDEDEGGTPEYRRELIAKVRDKLYDERLQRRYRMKRSSKTAGFARVDWDVQIKHFDSTAEHWRPLPYVTCRLSFLRVREGPYSFWDRPLDSVDIALSSDEITYLMRSLQRAQEHLTMLENTSDDD